MKTLGISIMLLSCTVVMAEKPQWYSGAFQESGSGKVTTASTVTGTENGVTKYVFGFNTAKSNQATIQYPLKAETGKNAVNIEAQSKSGTVNAEVWIEATGWKYQGKIKIVPGKFTKFLLPLKQCKSDELKWFRLVIPNKNNPKRDMLMLKTPILCSAKVVESHTWHTGVFDAKVKSSCEQTPNTDGSINFSWKFGGVKSGPVYLMTKLVSKDPLGNFEVTAKNPGKKPVVFQIWIEATGWKYQGKLKVDSPDWKTTKFKLKEAKSTETKYLRLIAVPKENAMSGTVIVKDVKYVK